MPNSLILASGSPQRKRILKQLGIRFKAIPSHIAESHDGRKRPHAIVKRIALKKARAIAKKHPKSWVLGVDTLVVLKNGTISGKPKNKKEAKAILKTYPGAHCDVYSGIALVNRSLKKEFVDVDRTRLYFNNVTEKDIDRYLNNHRWRGSSGAMTIEGAGKKWIKKLEGDYWNVVGLPVHTLKKLLMLAKAGEL
ncbi:MAG: nucleoside triphosphate pyrophosphatase [Candidatus Peregrinibacteria bacterium]